MLLLTIVHDGKTEGGITLAIGAKVMYLGHVIGGMVEIEFADGTKDIAHPKCFEEL